jgi:hypothetical protein
LPIDDNDSNPMTNDYYETVLAEYSHRNRASDLLMRYRPYLEMLPSMRRPEESVKTIPFPVVRLRRVREDGSLSLPETRQLPCELAILTCDPEWKIKLGVEIIVFIHRPEEDFSNLLSRWRQTQVLLAEDYEWLMLKEDRHLFSERAEEIYPLFVVFEETLDRIKRGLAGADLPFIIYGSELLREDELLEAN